MRLYSLRSGGEKWRFLLDNVLRIAIRISVRWLLASRNYTRLSALVPQETTRPGRLVKLLVRYSSLLVPFIRDWAPFVSPSSSMDLCIWTWQDQWMLWLIIQAVLSIYANVSSWQECATKRATGAAVIPMIISSGSTNSRTPIKGDIIYLSLNPAVLVAFPLLL